MSTTQPNPILVSTNPSTPNSISKGIWIEKIHEKIVIQSTRSIGVKKISFFAHKNMVDAIKKGSKLFMESMDQIITTNVVLEEKWIEYLKQETKLLIAPKTTCFKLFCTI